MFLLITCANFRRKKYNNTFLVSTAFIKVYISMQKDRKLHATLVSPTCNNTNAFDSVKRWLFREKAKSWKLKAKYRQANKAIIINRDSIHFTWKSKWNKSPSSLLPLHPFPEKRNLTQILRKTLISCIKILWKSNAGKSCIFIDLYFLPRFLCKVYGNGN